MKQQSVDIDIAGLYYITHIDNLMSITKRGILSHARIRKERIFHTAIYDPNIVIARAKRPGSGRNSLWNFANLFFNPRNSMLYRVLMEQSVENIAIIVVDPAILEKKGIRISTGNARAWRSQIFARNKGLLEIKEIQKSLETGNRTHENKAKLMAECLVPESVPPAYIHAIYVVSNEVVNKIRAQYPDTKIDIIPQPYMFFRPSLRNPFMGLSMYSKENIPFLKKWKQTEINFVATVNQEPPPKMRYHVIGASFKDRHTASQPGE